jgi:hypothetical protein
MSLDDMLHSLNRRSLLAAETEDEHAEKLKDEIADIPRKFPGSSKAWMDEHAREKQSEARTHEHKARVYRRRAEHAGAGYLLMSRDEHTDHEFMGQHGGLVAAASAAGRLRTAEPLPSE